jgi:DNA-directed RNA polymerase specialized sigma24 family protein
MMTTKQTTEETPVLEGTTTKAKGKTGAHYVDNKKFYEALVVYRKEVDTAAAAGKEQPIVPDYIGECFIKIATHLSYKANFINYTFKDDMISDGIENCLTAVAKFDPEKSTNPFAYYTQIIYFAFIRRIQKEKKQQATKYELIKNLDINELITQDQDSGEFTNQFLEYLKRQLDQNEVNKIIKDNKIEEKKDLPIDNNA